MKDLAIYCAGGFGREVYCMIFNRIKNSRWKFAGFFDDGLNKGEQLQYGPCLGGMNDLNSWPTPIDLVIANGSPLMLKKISDSIKNVNVDFPNIIDPSVIFLDFDSIEIGKGNIFNINCNLTCNLSIGSFNIMNGNIGMGHEVKIGNHNVFMPGAQISGAVSIGNMNLLGAKSFVLQGLSIGNGFHLSPGSILLTKPKNFSTYIGNPAKRLKF